MWLARTAPTAANAGCAAPRGRSTLPTPPFTLKPRYELPFSLRRLTSQSRIGDMSAIRRVWAWLNAIKQQAKEFRLDAGGQRLAALHAFITDVNSLGLPTPRP